MSHTSLSKIIRNPFYIGVVSWNGIITQGQHEALITKELFDKVQERLKSEPYVKYQRDKSPKRPFMLQGLVRCDNCGYTLCRTCTKGDRAECLQCGGYSAKKCFVSHSILVKKLNEKVLTLLEDITALDNFLFEPIEKAEPKDNKHRIELLIQHEKNKLKRAREAYENEVYSLEEFKETKQAVEKRIAKFEAELSDVPIEKDTSELKNKILDALSLLKSDTLSEEEKNVLLKSFISKIVFKKPSNDLDIYFYG